MYKKINKLKKNDVLVVKCLSFLVLCVERFTYGCEICTNKEMVCECTVSIGSFIDLYYFTYKYSHINCDIKNTMNGVLVTITIQGSFGAWPKSELTPLSCSINTFHKKRQHHLGAKRSM